MYIYMYMCIYTYTYTPDYVCECVRKSLRQPAVCDCTLQCNVMQAASRPVTSSPDGD